MKNHLLSLSFLIIISWQSNAQSLILKGKIKCYNQSENSSKGAENVVVVPAFIPSRSTITSSYPSGYFEMNLGVSIAKLQDKIIALHSISKCTSCKQATKRIFISEDQDRTHRNDQKQYVTVKDWVLNTNCQQAELVPLAADSVLNIITRHPGQDINKMTAASALVGTPAFLNLLTSLITVIGATGFPTGQFVADSIHQGKISHGKLLLHSPLYHSANTGFNFSPSRDMSEAIFWNPSAMIFSRKAGNISLLTNAKNNAKLGGFFKASKDVTIGVGGMATLQDEFRGVTFRQNLTAIAKDSLIMNNKEYSAYLSAAVRISKKVGVGASVKWLKQDISLPNMANVDNSGTWVFIDSSTSRQLVDADISATCKLNNALQFGLNVMNIANSALYQDAFTPLQVTRFLQRQRSVGIGASYKHARLNIGADMIYNNDGLVDATLGANFVPFNNALIAGGFSFRTLTYSLVFRLKHFRIAYINDQGTLVNEIRTPKLRIFNGRIHGGFIFDIP